MAYTVPSVWEYKRGDQRPNLTHTLRDDSRDPIDVSGADEVRLVIEHTNEEMPRVNAPISIDNAPQGEVSYRWQEGDLGRSGEYLAEFVIYWGGRKQTVPDQDYYYITVDEPLGYNEDPIEFDGEPDIGVGIVRADEIHSDRITTRSDAAVALDADLDAGGTSTIHNLPAPTDPNQPARLQDASGSEHDHSGDELNPTSVTIGDQNPDPTEYPIAALTVAGVTWWVGTEETAEMAETDVLIDVS